jgi:metal-responsive CopG/Arc/MetJ family transcriptional regulator
MSRSKIAITLDDGLLAKVDELVAALRFPNRSRAIEEAVAEKLARMERSRLARESAKLDRSFERRLAEEGLSEDVGEWPEY